MGKYSFITEVAQKAADDIIDILSKCNEETWATLAAAFPSISGQLTSYSEPILHVHKFVGGLNILNTPVVLGKSEIILEAELYKNVYKTNFYKRLLCFFPTCREDPACQT